jgi:fumarylacetoacetate (FAA) hydrolase
MKLASLPQGRDGRLIVVSEDLHWYADADHIVPTLQGALDDWARFAPALGSLAIELEHGAIPQKRFHEREAAAPLPRVYAQGSSGGETHGARDAIDLADEGSGGNFGAEICVVTGDVPRGVSAADALGHVRLVGLVNAITLRGIGGEKCPVASHFSPVFVTPDSLGDAWGGGRLNLPFQLELNGKAIAQASNGADFAALIADQAQTSGLGAGTMISAGAASNGDPLKYGDTVRIDMRDAKGRSIFGAIEGAVMKG